MSDPLFMMYRWFGASVLVDLCDVVSRLPCEICRTHGLSFFTGQDLYDTVIAQHIILLYWYWQIHKYTYLIIYLVSGTGYVDR